MTNTIPAVSQMPMPEPSGGQAPPPRPAAPAPSAAAAPQSEAVTLSAAAQASTQLLSAARASDGINHAAVAQIRSALQSGTYNVAPQDLAQAIATVLKETK